MNYFEHHIGDYAEATSHLSFVEDAAYHRCIRKYYATERPLPADIKDVQRLVGARSKEERAAVETVLREFFVLRDDGWHQKRCDAEIERYQEKRAKASASANARWSKSERDANAMRTHSDGNAEDGCERNANACKTHDERNAHQAPDTKHHSEAKLPRGARGTRLPPEWDPGDTGWAYAASQGLANGFAQRVLEDFRDYWTAKAGKDAAKLDWQATWRKWVRTASEERGKPAVKTASPWDGAH